MLGVGFFSSDKFFFLTSHFDSIFVYHSKGIVVLSLNLEKNFTGGRFL